MYDRAMSFVAKVRGRCDMGEFTSNLTTQSSTPTLFDLVCNALMEKGDGSLDEFHSALRDPSITAISISHAILKTTKKEVSDRTIQRWRVHQQMLDSLQDGENNG